MRAIRFLPLVFLVGIDGFAMFAPYVVLILSIAYLIRRAKAMASLQPVFIMRS